MRPLELRIRDFRSYRGDEAVFDFRGRRLVGIVGPIGSGKSSILDAISFALYGRTPTVAAGTKALIHQRADGATVALRFDVDGEVWEAVRAVRKRGQSQHALYRLSADAPDAERVEKIILEAEVNAKVVELLGLEFDAFSRSVLLAQGRFAEFLRARPAERDRVLKGVFGHDRIDALRALAKDKAGVMSAGLETLTARVDHVEGVAARLAARRRDLADLQERIEAIRKAEPGYTDLTERIDKAMSDIARSEVRRDELEALVSRLPEVEATRRVVQEALDADATRAALGASLEKAQSALAEAEAALAIAERAGMRDRVERAGAALAAREPQARRVDELGERVRRLAERVEAAGATVVARASDVVAARAAVDATGPATRDAAAALADAEAVLHEARHADMALTLRTELVAGDSCPVCEQHVPEVPETPGAAPLEGFERAALEARDAARVAADASTEAVAVLEAGRTAHEASVGSLDAAREEHDASVEAVEAAVSELTATDTELVALLGEGVPGARLDDLRAQLHELGAAVAETRRTVERVRLEHDEAIRLQQDVSKELAQIRVALVDLAARLDRDHGLRDDDPGSVLSALTDLQTAWDQTILSITDHLAATTKSIKSATADRTAVLEDLDIAGDFTTELAKEEARAEMLGAEVERDAADVAQQADLIAERDALGESRDLHQRLATDLGDARFVRYLLDDERARLADLGSDHFQRLSSGRYRFTTEGSFSVIDLTAADATRKADSLSGGETFLASLALALALAEMVSRLGSRLDAFFLDEGFGTLDAEHLDLAMEGIELLAAGRDSRLVVVVSHVPELRHRLEDLIELEREPLTGDTRVVLS